MVEIKKNNVLFQFKIINYESPESDDTDYSGNWLIIEINVNNGNLSWTKIDPSLLTWDVKSIVEWFYQLSKDEKPPKKLGFIEHTISFEYKKNDKTTTIIIYFYAELLPDNFNREKKCFIKFDLTNEELYEISKQFEEELNKFPIRE